MTKRRAALLLVTALAGCRTPAPAPLPLAPAEVRALSADETWDFALGVDGDDGPDIIALRVVSPRRCPRGERQVVEGRPSFAFALERCDEESGERMLFSVDAVVLSFDERTPIDPRARIEVAPSVGQVQVPKGALDDALALVLDAERARAILDGERHVSLLAEGTLMHREGSRSHTYGRRTVKVRGVDAALVALGHTVAARALPADPTFVERPPETAPQAPAARYVTDALTAPTVDELTARVRARCAEGLVPVLGVVTEERGVSRVLLVAAPGAAAVRCRVDVVEERRLVETLGRDPRPPSVAVAIGDRVVLVFVDEDAAP